MTFDFFPFIMDVSGKLVNVLSFEMGILVSLTKTLSSIALSFCSEPSSFSPSTVFAFALFWFPCALEASPDLSLEVCLTLNLRIASSKLS